MRDSGFSVTSNALMKQNVIKKTRKRENIFKCNKPKVFLRFSFVTFQKVNVGLDLWQFSFIYYRLEVGSVADPDWRSDTKSSINF